MHFYCGSMIGEDGNDSQDEEPRQKERSELRHFLFTVCDHYLHEPENIEQVSHLVPSD